MKSFGEYLMESSTKTYDFKIKIAERIDDEVLTHIESALKAVDLANIGKPKHLPMQTHREFTSLGPVEASLLDVSVGFPVNETQIKGLIVDRAFVDGSKLVVYPKGRYELIDSAEPDGELFKKTGESILDKEELEDESGQEQVGDKRVSSFMKDLATRKYEVEGDNTPAAKTTNELPQNNTSVMGTHKPTMPKVGK